MTELIRTEDLQLTYPDGTIALRGIDMALHDAEIVGLIGENGSGKSTLSKCLNATLKPTSGRVLVEGKDTRKKANVKEVVKQVGYVFQNPDHQLFNRTVWDEIAYGPRNMGMADEEIDARVGEAAEVAGVGEQLFERHPNKLTKGLRQRVAIASVLAMKPNTIIVDEPTTGQDARQSLEIMNFLRKLRVEEDRTVVIVTHIIPIVQRYCDRVLCLRDGGVLLEGSPKEVFGQPEVLAQSAVRPSQIARFSHELAERYSDIDAPYLVPEEAVDDLKIRLGT